MPSQKKDSAAPDSFSQLNLGENLLLSLEKLGFTNPTPIQRQSLIPGLQKRDLIAIAQTGSGKTLAFVLIALQHLENSPSSRALFLAPSREVAQQIFKVITDITTALDSKDGESTNPLNHLSGALIIGGTPNAKQVNRLKKNPRYIVATPGRMNDHLQSNKLLLQGVDCIVIDEADRMLDMGFAPQIDRIKKTLRGHWQTLMYSASLSDKVEEIARSFMLSRPQLLRLEKSQEPVTELKQKIIFMDRAQKHDRLLDELNATKGGVIVFTGNQESCEKLAAYLEEYGYASDLIHGNLSQGHRNRVVREFREGSLRILVATDLLARGIDVPHVNCVINFEMPYSSEDFLHRIGRTARAGREGLAISFVTPSDARTYAKIKSYISNQVEIKLDPSFKFIERPPRNQRDRRGGPAPRSSGAPKSSGAPRSSAAPRTPGASKPAGHQVQNQKKSQAKRPQRRP